MPSSATITSSEMTTFVAGTVIRSAEVNSNFSIFRGHLLPVDPNTSTAATSYTYDLGSSGYAWRDGYVQKTQFAELSSATSTPTTGFLSAYAKTDGLLYTKNDSGTERQLATLDGTETLQNKKISLQNGTSTSELAIFFADDANTGLYSSADDKVEIVAGGYTGVQVAKSTGAFANLGLGGNASASDSYPILIQRSNVSVGTILQISNPATDASSKASIQLSTDNGNNLGEISVFTAATATDAYADSMVIRPSDGTSRLSLIGGDLTASSIAFYTGGVYTNSGKKLEVTSEGALHLVQEISTPATPSSGLKIYAKSDNKVYQLNDSGVEAQLGGSGGGGGGSLQWIESANAPVTSVANNFRIYTFESGLGQALYASIRAPSSYVAGVQIFLYIQFYSAGTSNNALMQSVSTLIRTGTDAISSTTNQRTSTNAAVTLSGGTANIPQAVTLDLTDSSGQINGVAVAAGDLILIKLTRGTDTSTSDINVPVYGAEIKASS
jgi:hypothetical protein